MRYRGQSYELSVPVESLDPTHFLPLFHDTHRERYGHSDPTRTVEIVNLRLKLTLPAPQSVILSEAKDLSSASKRGHDTPPKPLTHRDAWYTTNGNNDSARTPVYDRETLAPGHKLTGPAIIVQMDSTTVIPPAWHATVDQANNLILEPSTEPVSPEGSKDPTSPPA